MRGGAGSPQRPAAAAPSVGRRRRIALAVNQSYTVAQVVATSDLLTVLPHHFLSSTGRIAELAVLPLPLEVPAVHVGMLWYWHHESVSAQRWLRDTVVRAVASAPAHEEAL
ncbi:MAG: LysR substrate-binding domain-containing protein [Tepidimonas sp.]|uniref:LysR substrate-binding domain-containing protein n=1 Tax=Tepidimonas sp. TaxID=2002775 RepID=UPI0040550C39